MQTQSKFIVSYRKDSSFNEIEHLNLATSQNNSRQGTIENSFLYRRNVKNKKWKNLKQIVSSAKVKRLTQNFIKKLRFNSIHRAPLQQLQDHKSKTEYNNTRISKVKQQFQILGNKDGLILNNWCLIFWNILNILQTCLLVFISSMMTSFSETTNSGLFFNIRAISCFMYVLDVFVNFVLQRYESGKKLCKISEISGHYAKNGFITIDLPTLLIFIISLYLPNTTLENMFVTLVYVIKLFSSIRKLQKFEYLIITSNQKQQYYGLIKVFLTNFLIGHFLSVFLNLMPSLNSQINWHIKMGIMDSIWYIKYIWGYYWGTNIMLTVGFGDISATNYQEAIILVFIQTFSCITLAYNISYVGALIGSIRENSESRKRKLKIFHRMCKENQVSSQIQSKISNFIEESYEIKEAFEYDARDEVIEFLPKSMQREYRKEANNILFDGLGFLNNLSKRSLLALAEQVSRKICHPQQIIVKKGNITDFYILQKGCLAFACKSKSNLDGKIIQLFQVQGNAKPKILSLSFIKNKVINYNIKSLNYSVLYYLKRQNFMESLSCSQMDYQLFCLMKDKDQYILHENNLYLCPYCTGQYHDKFECTRLHYIPLKQNIIMRYLTKSNKNNHGRAQFYRSKKIMENPYPHAKELKEEQRRYVEENFDKNHTKEIQELIQFYEKNTNFLNSDKHIETEKDVNGGTVIKKNPSGTFGRAVFDDKAILKLEKLLEANAHKNQNNFWEFEVDTACDFGYYFKEGNPDNLHRIKKYKKLKNQVYDQKNTLSQNQSIRPISIFF